LTIAAAADEAKFEQSKLVRTLLPAVVALDALLEVSPGFAVIFGMYFII
jgi:hypothetical protein